MGQLDDRVALVTGGARGQGRSHAVHLAREGAKVIICDIEQQIGTVEYPMSRPGDMDETVRLVEAEDQPCLAVRADVRDPEAMMRVAQEAMDHFGRIDILVANAGILASARTHEMSPAQWRDVIDVDLSGVFYAISAVSPVMVEQKYGRIIATSSVAGHAGYGNLANYCAAKWGVIGLIKSAAIDLGPYNITANAVCPGQTNTDMLNNDALLALWFPDVEKPTQADMDKLTLETMHYLPVAQIPPSDISAAVVFLASEKARYVSGSTVDVSAGMAANSMA